MNSFIKALQSGNVKQAKRAMAKNGFDVTASAMPPSAQMGHYPILCVVAEGGLVEIAKIILEEKGANVNDVIGCNGMSALYIACQEGFTDMAALFISKGADCNVATTDQDNCTPLHIAAQFGHLKIIKLLVKNGANVNVKKKNDGVTPLFLAVRTLHEDIALYLIQEGGADVTATLHNGVSILMIAASRGMKSVIQLLLDAGEDPFEECDMGCSAIDFAATAGHKALADMMKAHPRPKRTTTTLPPTSATSSVTSSDQATGKMVKELAAMNVNVYSGEPLRDDEIASGHEFQKEKKYKCCSNPSCGKTEKEVGKSFAKCNRCRCVRYCGADCQKEHWKIHKKMCRKPMC
mmetsp:Transcript_18567/g.30940  ORF Transcript_18567/g.30940 Transcript_18567/m.30940 type:complete len:349 (+) Transcript_18567:108-1154(+)